MAKNAVVAVLFLFVLTVACASDPTTTPAPVIAITPEVRVVTATPSPTPSVTPTPVPPTATWTPEPTPTPSSTPRPTRTPMPTPTPTPTITPTPEPKPTATPKPTPTPTRTPRPTIPTWTPTPVVPLSQKWDVRTALGVRAAHTENRAKTLKKLVVAGCYAGLQDISGGETWFTFSRDGEFSKDRKFISITGFSKNPNGGQCYEMVVTYEKEANYCYYVKLNNVPIPNIPGHCPSSGWWQDTREFYLVDKDAWRLIPKDEWRRDYRDAYAR